MSGREPRGACHILVRSLDGKFVSMLTTILPGIENVRSDLQTKLLANSPVATTLGK